MSITGGWAKDQLVDSLAWFSFHVPAIVLEDISELNSQEEEEEILRNSNPKKELTRVQFVDCETSEIDESFHLPKKEEEKNNSKPNESGPDPDVSSKVSAMGEHTQVKFIDFETEEKNNSKPIESGSDPDVSSKLSAMRSSRAIFSRPQTKSRDRRTVCIGKLPTDFIANKTSILGTVTFGRNSSQSDATEPGLPQNHFKVPPCKERECALLFIDISGFTKLSTEMGVEAFSETINTYFDKIVTEIKGNGGDILKFAGDALFAEWRVQPPTTQIARRASSVHNTLDHALQKITRSLKADEGITLEKCVTDAALCGSSIVEALSDYEVKGRDDKLNVHCGLGAGKLIGLHTENKKGNRREYIFLGDIIDQVSMAEGKASHGELAASPQAIKLLSKHCRLPPKLLKSESPSVIATRGRRLFRPTVTYVPFNSKDFFSAVGLDEEHKILMKETENIDCGRIEKLQRQLSLYAHTVVCEDEYAKRPSSQTDSLELVAQRHRSEAELRDVYVMFINPRIDATVTGDYEKDKYLYEKLDAVMKEVCEVVEEKKGHLRQFIRDDKGIVLIATFGLRSSLGPNMVAARALPATILVHERLRKNLSIECVIGAAYGGVYCGVVGGVRRHEYAVIGRIVNLAARLMASKQNKGILVTGSIKDISERYNFKSYGSVPAKGYANPIPIYEPGEKSTDIPELPPIISVEKQIHDLGIQKIDSLGVVRREILKTCAVLGDEFQLFDVYRVNTEEMRSTIKDALNKAIRENILQEGKQKPGKLSASEKKNKTYRFTHCDWKKVILKNMTSQKIDEIKETLAHFVELRSI